MDIYPYHFLKFVQVSDSRMLDFGTGFECTILFLVIHKDCFSSGKPSVRLMGYRTNPLFQSKGDCSYWKPDAQNNIVMFEGEVNLPTLSAIPKQAVLI